jgi:hypothetical protein
MVGERWRTTRPVPQFRAPLRHSTTAIDARDRPLFGLTDSWRTLSRMHLDFPIVTTTPRRRPRYHAGFEAKSGPVSLRRAL